MRMLRFHLYRQVRVDFLNDANNLNLAVHQHFLNRFTFIIGEVLPVVVGFGKVGSFVRRAVKADACVTDKDPSSAPDLHDCVGGTANA